IVGGPSDDSGTGAVWIYTRSGGVWTQQGSKLVGTGAVGQAAPVSCNVRSGDDSAELSLAENVVRIAMHPADQFDAWRGLTDKGAGVSEIAARFGVAESTVRKRLALARVSPVIFNLYRQGEIELEALQAFTVTGRHRAARPVRPQGRRIR